MWSPVHPAPERIPSLSASQRASASWRTSSVSCPLGIWGPCCCCRRITVLWGSNQSIYSQAHKTGLLPSKIWIYHEMCVSAAARGVFSTGRSSSVWNEDLMSEGASRGLYGEDGCEVLSRSAARHNELLSGFRTELLWSDSLGASVKITLMIWSLCTAAYAQRFVVFCGAVLWYSPATTATVFPQRIHKNSPPLHRIWNCKSPRRKIIHHRG